MYEAEAKERQGKRTDLEGNLPTKSSECPAASYKTEAAHQAAAAVGVSGTVEMPVDCYTVTLIHYQSVTR